MDNVKIKPEKCREEIIFIITDKGDPSVGIYPYYEEITMSFMCGIEDPETKQEFIDQTKEYLKEWFCECGGQVYTKEEFDQKQQALVDFEIRMDELHEKDMEIRKEIEAREDEVWNNMSVGVNLQSKKIF